MPRSRADLGYLSAEKLQNLVNRVQEVGRILSGLLNALAPSSH